MAAEVSSLVRYLNGHRTVGTKSVSEKSTALITRDLLGGGTTKAEPEELDLDLHVPSGWEKRLDLTSGKVYIQRCGGSGRANPSSTRTNQSKLQDLNSPPSPSKLALNLLNEEPSLDLKLVSSSVSSSQFNYQSVCTLDKVKSALERAEREPTTKRRSPFWRALQSSPSCSSSSSGNKETALEHQKDEKKKRVLDSLSSPVATGCPSCLAYVLVLESNPKCPRCSASVPLPKKARIDLNMSI